MLVLLEDFVCVLGARSQKDELRAISIPTSVAQCLLESRQENVILKMTN